MVLVAAVLTAWVLGADPRRLAVLAAGLLWPLTLVALIVVAFWSSKRDRAPRSALFCEAVASELRAGSSLRDALASAISSVGGQPPSLLAGAPLAEVGEALASEFEDIGIELGMTINATGRSGGSSADLFDEIGSLAIARTEVEHEVRVATAPARATAFIFLAAPTAYLVARINSGSLTALVASPAQRVAGVIGTGLFVAGLLAAGVVLWRSR
jgi:Flp pilus assembly protein TadB